MENYFELIMIVLSFISIITIEIISKKRRNWFIGYITKNVNGRLIPAPILSYRENPIIFINLLKPLIFMFTIEIISTIIFLKYLF